MKLTEHYLFPSHKCKMGTPLEREKKKAESEPKEQLSRFLSSV